MKYILTGYLFCLTISSMLAQANIETVDIKTGIERIVADYPSKFQNIKVMDTCHTFCQLNFYIAGSYYPYCEVSTSYSRDPNNICSITFSNYNYPEALSIKYSDYPNTDTLTMKNLRADIKTAIYDAVLKTFGNVTVTESDCKSLDGNDICKKYRLQTEDVNTNHEYFEVEMKMTTKNLNDGTTYWYTNVYFEMQKW